MDTLGIADADDRESHLYHSRTEYRTRDHYDTKNTPRYHDRIRYITLDAGRGHITESDHSREERDEELCPK